MTNKMINADVTRVLMSEALRSRFNVDDVAEDVVDPADDSFKAISDSAVYVIIDRRLAGQQAPVSGVLRSVLFDVEPEVELLMELTEAFAMVRAESMTIGGFELHHGEESTVKVPGPFTVKAARIQEIDVLQQSCVMALQLQRKKA